MDKIFDALEQMAELDEAIAAGWKIYTDVDNIRARYQDRDVADRVPRAIIYMDIGVLVSLVDVLRLPRKRPVVK